MFSPKRTFAGRLHLGRANAREAAILNSFTKQIATVVWDFSLDGGAVQTYRFNAALPVGAVVTSIWSDEQTAVAGATSMTLYAGSIPLTAAIDFTATSGVNKRTLLGGATAIQPSLTNTSELNMVLATTPATAGKIRFAVEFWSYAADASAATVALAQTLINQLLGASNTYEVLAGSAVTNTGTTAVTGDVGVSPSSSITGFPPGVITGGSQHSNDASAIAAQVALTSAISTLGAMTTTADLSGTDLGGLVLGPGVYNFSSSAGLTGILTLDAGGNPNAQFVFKIASTLTTATASSVVLANGALAGNVCWKVGSSATLGTSTAFQGSILASTAITLVTSATINGKLLASSAAVTLDTNTAAS